MTPGPSLLRAQAMDTSRTCPDERLLQGVLHRTHVVYHEHLRVPGELQRPDREKAVRRLQPSDQRSLSSSVCACAIPPPGPTSTSVNSVCRQ